MELFEEQSSASARLAYIVAAHPDPVRCGRLLARIAGPRVACFVHVDAPSKLAAYRVALAGLPNVHLVHPPVTKSLTGLGAWSTTGAALEQALAMTGEDCTHFVVLDAAAQPSATSAEILDFFEAQHGRELVRSSVIMELQGIRWWRRTPTMLRVAVGPQWVAITPALARVCLQRASTYRGLVRTLRGAYGPESFLIHTVLENSDLRDRADHAAAERAQVLFSQARSREPEQSLVSA